MSDPQTSGIAAAQLRSIVERIERLNEEIKDLNADKSDVLKEARGNGYDADALKKLVAIRAKDPAKLAEQEAILDLYKSTLGMA
jgi:uncharacterized protein (UPF0335 family)